ncbi:MAG: PHP domain-containing protein [Lachnospiraceae bacterium]|nr:PHP domain-containing protein [Lachnospiraceae bacterium]
MSKQKKRFELHAHTKYSQKQGVSSYREMVEAAQMKSVQGIAITDCGNLNALYEDENISNNDELNAVQRMCGTEIWICDESKDNSYRATLLAIDQDGLKCITRILSEGSLKDHNNNTLCVQKSLVDADRNGIMVGCAFDEGEVINALLSDKTDDEIKDVIKFYDYVEVAPLSSAEHLIDNREISKVHSRSDIEDMVKRITELCEDCDVPVVAVSDAYYAFQADEKAQLILASYYATNERHGLYIKTTDELLEEFRFLGKDMVSEIVIDNSRMIADRIIITPPALTCDKYPIMWDGCGTELAKKCFKRAEEIYGKQLPDEVRDRIGKELEYMYPSEAEGLIVSISDAFAIAGIETGDYSIRGSGGASFIGYLMGINGGINPLKPHYYCTECNYSEFNVSGNARIGMELPEKVCPVCGKPLLRDGFNLDAWYFYGRNGGKEPDFDYNLASGKRGELKKALKKAKGISDIVECGTSSSVSENGAERMIAQYEDRHNLSFVEEERSSLKEKLEGCIIGYGEHPGGVLLIPDRIVNVNDHIQTREDDGEFRITIPDYHNLDRMFIKLDILRHQTVGQISRLAELTGIRPDQIPLDDKDVTEAFQSGGKGEYTFVGIFDLMGDYIAKMLDVYKINNLYDIARLSALCHGTAVWMDNGEELLRNKTISQDELLCSRDDVYEHLLDAGFDRDTAFRYAERIRKGKKFLPEQEEELRAKGISDWFIDSCNKIRYMFPKAHCISYAIMSWQLMYYKIHCDQSYFYRAFLETMDVEEVVYEAINSGKEKVAEILEESLQGWMVTPDWSRSDEFALLVAKEMLDKGLYSDVVWVKP